MNGGKERMEWRLKCIHPAKQNASLSLCREQKKRRVDSFLLLKKLSTLHFQLSTDSCHLSPISCHLSSDNNFPHRPVLHPDDVQAFRGRGELAAVQRVARNHINSICAYLFDTCHIGFHIIVKLLPPRCISWCAGSPTKSPTFACR